MVLSPVKVLFVSSLTVIGGGVLAVNVSLKGTDDKSNFTNLVGNDFQSNSLPGTSCNIYIVEKPTQKDTDGKWKVTKIRNKKETNNKNFLDDRAHDRNFVEKIKSKGCKKDFRNIYVYYEGNYYWSYDDDLQRKDGVQDETIERFQ